MTLHISEQSEHRSQQIHRADPRQVGFRRDSMRFRRNHGAHRRDHGLRNFESASATRPAWSRRRWAKPTVEMIDDADRRGDDSPCGSSLSSGVSELLRRRAERLRLGLPQEHEGRQVHREGRVHLVRRASKARRCCWSIRCWPPDRRSCWPTTRLCEKGGTPAHTHVAAVIASEQGLDYVHEEHAAADHDDLDAPPSTRS